VVKEKWGSYFEEALKIVWNSIVERVRMRSNILSLVAAAALLASVGAANAADHATANAADHAPVNAKGPVKLTDNQLDTVTAGDAASLLAANYQLLNTLLTLNTNLVAFPLSFTP
jgi:cytochrome oxidase Cu insertion factor (SCO1/SenC/PrrC family)